MRQWKWVDISHIVCSLWPHCEGGCMWLLAFPAPVETGTLFHVVTKLETVHAEIICPDSRNLFIMSKSLEACTCVQWMFFCFAEDATCDYFRDIGRERCCCFVETRRLGDVDITSWSLLEVCGEHLRGLGSEVEKFQEFIVVRHINWLLAAFLPFEHGIRVQ